MKNCFSRKPGLAKQVAVRINSVGFTLIEILVVLVIVAIIIAVAVLALGNMGQGRREHAAVQELVRVIGAAQQQAILTPAILGLGFHSDGYRFYQYRAAMKRDKAAWIPLHNDVLSNPVAFHDLLIAQLTAVSGYTETTESHASHPIIFFSSGGSVTPFVLTLQGEKITYIVSVQNNGVVKVMQKKHVD